MQGSRVDIGFKCVVDPPFSEASLIVCYKAESALQTLFRPLSFAS